MASDADMARMRIDEIKFRNQGGNMEGIPGFNFEYNDREGWDEKPAPPPKAKPKAADLLGGMPRARRASDGAVLKMPYKVVLKSKKPGPPSPVMRGARQRLG